MVVVAQQSEVLQAATVKWMTTDLRVRDLPAVSLVNCSYPVIDNHLAQRVDRFLFTHDGKIDMKIAVKKIFLVGGYEDSCLRSTIEIFAANAAKAGLKSISIHLISDLVYARNPMNLRQRLMKDVADDEPGLDRLQEIFWRYTLTRIQSAGSATPSMEFSLIERNVEVASKNAAFGPLAGIHLFIE